MVQVILDYRMEEIRARAGLNELFIRAKFALVMRGKPWKSTKQHQGDKSKKTTEGQAGITVYKFAFVPQYKEWWFNVMVLEAMKITGFLTF
jgi:hypothetical protein